MRQSWRSLYLTLDFVQAYTQQGLQLSQTNNSRLALHTVWELQAYAQRIVSVSWHIIGPISKNVKAKPLGLILKDICQDLRCAS